MSLQETILDIQIKLKNNEYPNEQSISQGIVLRLLSEMNWPIYDPQTVTPEYSVKGKRVDFALCTQKNKPIIFIEVKRTGNTLGADEQLFQYAFHQGVPFAIVTDGEEWNFYLPAESGSYDERKVYELNLIERSTSESVTRLQRYLNFEQVKNGNALEHAREDYKNVTKTRQAKEKIPLAWEQLLAEKDEILTGVIAEKVESICGYKPTQKQVVDYLTSFTRDVSDFQPAKHRTSTAKPRARKPEGSARLTTERMKIEVTFPDGVVICRRNVGQTMVEVFRKISFSNVAALNITTKGYPLVSKQQHTHRGQKWTPAGSGFFVCTQSSTPRKMKYLTTINERLGLKLRIKQVSSTQAT